MARLILFFLVFPLVSLSQFNGEIVYSIEYVDLEGKLLASLEGVATSLTEHVSGLQLRTDQSTRMGEQSTIYNAQDSTYVILVKFEDRNIAIRMPKEYASKSGMPTPTIKYKRCKRKKVAGFKCKLAIVTYPDKIPTEVWYTNQIPALLNQKFEGLKGYPLDYSFNMDDGKQIQRAVQITQQEVDSSIFLIPEGYTEMTMDEFQKSLGY